MIKVVKVHSPGPYGGNLCGTALRAEYLNAVPDRPYDAQTPYTAVLSWVPIPGYCETTAPVFVSAEAAPASIPVAVRWLGPAGPLPPSLSITAPQRSTIRSGDGQVLNAFGVEWSWDPTRSLPR